MEAINGHVISALIDNVIIIIIIISNNNTIITDLEGVGSMYQCSS
jgi:hypothetical protein